MNQHTGLVWSGPPPRSKVGNFVAALKERPGEWAEYPHPLKFASASSGYQRRYPNTEWTARLQPDGTYKAWARWVGMEKFTEDGRP